MTELPAISSPASVRHAVTDADIHNHHIHGQGRAGTEPPGPPPLSSLPKQEADKVEKLFRQLKELVTTEQHYVRRLREATTYQTGLQELADVQVKTWAPSPHHPPAGIQLSDGVYWKLPDFSLSLF